MSSDLHILTLYFPTDASVVPIRLMFNGPDRATAARSAALAHDPTEEAPSLIKDDFGNELAIFTLPWFALLTHVARDLEGAGELKLIEARSNIALQRRAQSDPAINSSIIPVSGLVNKH